MKFEITYQDSYGDCDSICVEEDEVFSIPNFDDVYRPCCGGQIIDDDDDNVVEEDITIYRNKRYVLRGDTLYIKIRGREIPWDQYYPEC